MTDDNTDDDGGAQNNRMATAPLEVSLDLEWNDGLVDSPEGDIDLLLNRLEESDLPVENVRVLRRDDDNTSDREAPKRFDYITISGRLGDMAVGAKHDASVGTPDMIIEPVDEVLVCGVSVLPARADDGHHVSLVREGMTVSTETTEDGIKRVTIE